jgi:tetratricopeptide (TPR) repeat protein
VHYYHAVGLTEKDDIVGACEHYLIALEIMEDDDLIKSHRDTKTQRHKGKGLCDSAALRLCDFNKEDYEKIRFMALIYTRLGKLFLNENYCDLAITKYSKALKYVEMIDERSFMADILKFLGNSYQLSNNVDSALYYYNESLKCNSSLNNKLDVEKNIAQILFYKGERDSAYRLINDNLNKLEGYAAKYSYYQILGEMYHSDNSYDSAIKYLNLSMCATNKHTILASSNILTTIYDSIGNINLKFFYDSISLSILSSNHNKSIYKTKLQNVYSEYENRKQVREIEKEKIESRKHIVKYLIISLSFTLVLVYIIFVLRHRYRKDKIKYDKKIFNMNSEISEKNVEIENGKQTISVINSELENLTKKYDKLSNDYISNKKELEKTLSRKITKNDIKNFCNCENSKKILANIDNIKNSNLKINNLAALTNKELRQLLDDADICLYDFTATITNKYPKLNDEDLYCICLLLLNIKGPTIAALLGKEYNSVWSRIKKIYSIIGINSKENLHKIFL